MIGNDEALIERSERYSLELEKLYDDYIATIKRGLADPYDAIVADAIDYVIQFGRVDDFSEEIVSLCSDDQSYFLKGRLQICGAKSQDKKVKDSIDGMDFDKNDDYNSIWFNIAQYIFDEQDSHLCPVRELTTSEDQTVASLARSMLTAVGDK
jgi:hypothetical protein